MKIPLMKQSDGKNSASFTMMAIGFGVITLWLVLSIFEELWGLKVRVFDPASAMAYLSPLMVLYFGRRYTDSKEASSSSTITTTATRVVAPADPAEPPDPTI